MSLSPRVLIFTGDGKGKTTAAFGMAMRAAGHGLRVAVVQFIKGDPRTGELRAAQDLPGIDVVQTGLGFLPPPTSQAFARHQAAAQQGLRKAEEIIAGGEHFLVVLDEVCLAVASGLIEERQVVEAIEKARPNTCLILTGRGATEGLIAAADTVTEMRPIKHGLESGRGAQKGVEL
jgi:cob(I)alamin adenosyltransferase